MLYTILFFDTQNFGKSHNSITLLEKITLWKSTVNVYKRKAQFMLIRVSYNWIEMQRSICPKSSGRGPSPPFPFLLPFLCLPLEVGPLNPARKSGGAL